MSRNADCLFCRIISRELPAQIEYENENLVILRDIQPQAPHHVLVIPRKHIARVSDLKEEDRMLAGNLLYQAACFAAEKGWADYRLLFNNGPQAGQSVYHIHLHILSGRKMLWPPG